MTGSPFSWAGVQSGVSEPVHRTVRDGRSREYGGSPVPESLLHSATLECSALQPGIQRRYMSEMGLLVSV